MIESIVIEFEKVTKYPLMKFMEEYRDFMTYSFSPIERYFSGALETIDNAHINALRKVTRDTQDVLQQFKNFANKFLDQAKTLKFLLEILEEIQIDPTLRAENLTAQNYLDIAKRLV